MFLWVCSFAWAMLADWMSNNHDIFILSQKSNILSVLLRFSLLQKNGKIISLGVKVHIFWKTAVWPELTPALRCGWENHLRSWILLCSQGKWECVIREPGPEVGIGGNWRARWPLLDTHMKFRYRRGHACPEYLGWECVQSYSWRHGYLDNRTTGIR